MSLIDSQSFFSEKLLLIDASSSTVYIGLMHNHKWLSFFKSEQESLVSVFNGVRLCLREVSLDLKNLDGFIFCRGPGKILSLRVAAMALNSWLNLPELSDKKLYSYKSFNFIASILLMKKEQLPFHIISAYRSDQWNMLSVENTLPEAKLKIAASEEIEKLSGDIFYIKQRESKYEPITQAKEIHYQIKKFVELVNIEILILHNDKAEVLTLKNPEFVKWNAKRHS